MASPAKLSSAALSDMMPSHLPTQTSQRAIGFTVTICIWQSSTSRASVAQASQSVAKLRIVVTKLSV